jgi:hypothetical protein
MNKPYQTVYEVPEGIYQFAGKHFAQRVFQRKSKGRFFLKLGNQSLEWLQGKFGKFLIVDDEEI